MGNDAVNVFRRMADDAPGQLLLVSISISVCPRGCPTQEVEVARKRNHEGDGKRQKSE